MSAVSTAAAVIGMQSADTANAVAAKMIKMNAEQGQAMASMLDQAIEANKAALQAAPAPGTGAVIDIRA